MRKPPEIIGQVDTLGRERWLELRRGTLGASDVAAVLGLSPYASAMSVYAEKILGSPEMDNDYLKWGRSLEPILLQWLSDEVGIKITQTQTFIRSGEYPFLSCTTDGITETLSGGLIPIEAKSTAWKDADWRDGVPDYVNAQVQAQMVVCGAPSTYVIATLGGQPPTWAIVERDETFINEIMLPEVKRFWFENVQKEVSPEPDGKEPTTKAIKRLHPGGNTELVSLDASFLELDAELVEKEAGLKLLKENVTEIKNRFFLAIGDSEGAELDNGTRLYWKPDKNGIRRWKRVEVRQ